MAGFSLFPLQNIAFMKAATLICRRDLHTGLVCLESLRRGCANLESMMIFEDGSLSDPEADQLAHELSPATVIRRSELDAQAEQILKPFPRCRAFRQENPLGLKLFDVPLRFGSQGLFFDSDIFFFRRVDFSAVMEALGKDFVFMRDPNQGYSARLVDLVIRNGLPMPSHVNTGIIGIPPDGHDLEFIEWFLGKPEFRLFPQIVEQTCYAALAGKRCVLLDSSQIACCRDEGEPSPELAALHFIGHHKRGLVQFVRKRKSAAADETPVQISVKRAGRLHFGRILAHSFRWRWRKLIGRLGKPKADS